MEENRGASMLTSSHLDTDSSKKMARLTLEDDEEDIDETLSERLLGLAEMFPESMNNFICSAVDIGIRGSKIAFNLGRGAMWVFVSSATIMALPVLFESERAQQQEQQLQQQRQILLGPNAAVSGSGGIPGMMPSMMPLAPPK